MNRDFEFWLQIKIDRETKEQLKALASHFERDMSKQIRHMVRREFESVFGQRAEIVTPEIETK